jgi:pyruvate dehydrogenase E1 component
MDAIQQRVLWLAVRMVDWANHDRVNPEGAKVGGHQASSASMVGIMTALWFTHLSNEDRISVKPHASPVFHAIQYLLGRLDRQYLTRLREFGGLQAYPSRTKDPDEVDFSTGSVGLGAVAPLFAATVRRWIDHHFEARPASRFVALIGDAELDEGNVWEAIADPSTQGLSNVLWVVDVNRQSLDRVVPNLKATRMMQQFAACSWNVIEVKYGRKLQFAFSLPGGGDLRRYLDQMSNEEYQSLFAYRGAELRSRFVDQADRGVTKLLAEVADEDLAQLLQNLGGHDVAELASAYREADRISDRPTVVFAYTVKGWGLPLAGDPLNHSALLSPTQIDEMRVHNGLTADTEWERFDPESPEGQLCDQVRRRLARGTPPPRIRVSVPQEVGLPLGKTVSTQESFGRLLARLADDPSVAPRLVTVSPDVAVSTSLGGWINKMGVFNPEEQPDWLTEHRLLRWQQGPRGHHIELGISEMNLFLLLGQLGLAHEIHGESLLPVGTVYDPFVCRGLDALIYANYSGARFVVVGTPSGVTLAPEGGAHQSTITASIGIEMPGIAYAEPAYGRALEWLLCDGLAGLTMPEGESLYLRLSTRTIDQSPFQTACTRRGNEAVRRDVLAGGHRLIEPESGTIASRIVIAACGAVLPEAVAAVEELAEEGVTATLLDVSSPDRLYRDWQAATQRAIGSVSPISNDHHLARLLWPDERGLPIVAVHDAASHSMAWLGSVFGTPIVALGVDAFGQSGSTHDLYRVHNVDTDAIVRAGLIALDNYERNVRRGD